MSDTRPPGGSSTRAPLIRLNADLQPRNQIKLAGRLDHIEPFYVMECAKAAAELARSPD
jgi:hypothetical protein